MTSYSSLFSTTVLAELAFGAAEDAVDAIALGLPGLNTTIRTRQTLRARLGNLLSRLQSISLHFPQKQHLFDSLSDTLTDWNRSKDLNAAIQWWGKLAATLDQLESTGFNQHVPINPPPCFTFSIDNGSNRLKIEPSTQFRIELNGLTTFGQESDFVQAVTVMCAKYRNHNQRHFASNDRLSLLRAYHLVELGVVPAPKIQPLRTDQLRPYPTYLALADPGRGHLHTTVWDNRLLEGLMVHVETIDRDGVVDRRQIEAYRIPSIRDVARIRVHVGEATPCSVYVGRPVFEGWRQDFADDGDKQKAFEQSLLKAVHTVAAACSGFFSLGVAECKIGLDGLTAQQAIETMRSIVGNVIRDRFRQRLSAAFNINTPIRDDRDNSRPRDVNDRMEIANLGIELAVLGGFDKVTWDGAIDGPSQPLLEQLSAAQLLELVHRAHERGLETYVSAGMTEAHMQTATQIGIGGVGMGILMHTKSSNGTITHLLPDRIKTVLQVRDAASQQPSGLAASALAKLDWLASNGPLPIPAETCRQKLFENLLTHHNGTSHEQALNEFTLKQLTVDAIQALSLTARETISVTRGPETSPINSDPVFEIAQGKLRSATARGAVEEAEELRFLITAEDAESLRALIGYE